MFDTSATAYTFPKVEFDYCTVLLAPPFAGAWWPDIGARELHHATVWYYFCYAVIRHVAFSGTDGSGPCLSTAIWRCRKNSSQWQRSFQWKLYSYWLKFLRQRHFEVVRQGPGVHFRRRSKCTVRVLSKMAFISRVFQYKNGALGRSETKSINACILFGISTKNCHVVMQCTFHINLTTALTLISHILKVYTSKKRNQN